ncbi:unnamed protein product [Protopolystoma xenopodis]|uniref:Uncharacterized protein n=1 Tax=Protopolystoma xenopodis TaxID=117903 RepID=A0A448XI84_9PLAT|nr:unnamed protein product [Protopolystoma xenopodis]
MHTSHVPWQQHREFEVCQRLREMELTGSLAEAQLHLSHLEQTRQQMALIRCLEQTNSPGVLLTPAPSTICLPGAEESVKAYRSANKGLPDPSELYSPDDFEDDPSASPSWTGPRRSGQTSYGKSRRGGKEASPTIAAAEDGIHHPTLNGPARRPESLLSVCPNQGASTRITASSNLGRLGAVSMTSIDMQVSSPTSHRLDWPSHVPGAGCQGQTTESTCTRATGGRTNDQFPGEDHRSGSSGTPEDDPVKAQRRAAGVARILEKRVQAVISSKSSR